MESRYFIRQIRKQGDRLVVNVPKNEKEFESGSYVKVTLVKGVLE